MELPNLDIISLIEKNPLSKLSDSYQHKFIEKISEKFSDTQQHIFVGSFYCYLNNDTKNDFVISLDDVWKWLGFSRIDHSKVVLKKHFNENIDYKLEEIGPELAGAKRGGHNKKKILMSVNTFKKLCLKSNTKKADEIHDYYIKLEEVLQEVLVEESEELKNKLLQKNQELENTKKQLEIKTKLAVKRWYDQEPGHVIYGYKSAKSDNKTALISIGKSKNIKLRESGYMTHNQNGDMFYIRRCYNCDLAEKVLHHILDKYREESNKEWFNISEELTIYTIDTVCDFLDSFINCSEKLPEFKIKEFINKLPINKIDFTVKLEKEEDLYIPNVVYNNEVKNYNKFINECCILEDSAYILPYDLKNAYRIWCKNVLSKDINNDLTTYLNNTFTMKDKYFDKTGIRHKIITNLKLKELVFTPIDKYNIKSYEKFIIDSCVVNYSYKMKISDFINSYNEWMKCIYPDYDVSDKHIREIKDYLNTNFFIESMVYGIQLKSDDLPNYRIKEFNKIYMINENKDIVNTFNGLNEASEKLELTTKEVSDIIRYLKVITYENEKVTLIYEKKENVIKTKNIESKPIYKYDFDTKQLLQTFTSTKEAAKNLEITTSTILRYIAVEKIFVSKKDNNKNIILTYKNDISIVVPSKPVKVVKSKPCKILYSYYNNTTNLFKQFNGGSDAAAELKIGQCTVFRRIKSKIPLKIIYNNETIEIIFTYEKLNNNL